MRFALTLAAVSAALVGLAQPAPAAVSNSVCHAARGAICSKAFFATGLCDGADQLAILAQPWEKRTIEIVGVALSFSSDLADPRQWPFGYAFAGNSFEPDVMNYLGREGSQTVMFPPGSFFQFPGSNEPEPPHVDLHLNCKAGAHYAGMLVLYYRFAEPAQTAGH